MELFWDFHFGILGAKQPTPNRIRSYFFSSFPRRAASAAHEGASRTKNSENVSKLVNSDDPMNSRFLIHPLSPMAGGDIAFVHGGERQFESKEDPDWQTMAE